MIAVTRCYEFSASHRLHIDGYTEVENAELYGKCNNPFGHGHNYRLEVSVAGPVHLLTGQVIPLGRLDQLVSERVLNLFDHRYINVEVPEFGSRVPTTENVVDVIAGRLRQHWSDYIPAHAQLYRVRIQETDRNAFEAVFAVDPPQSRNYKNSYGTIESFCC